MHVIGEAVIDSDMARANFCCDVSVCKGACCSLEGGRGAPLEDDEIREIQSAFPFVRPYLSEKSLSAIGRAGLFEGQPGDFATACVDGNECVFAYFENGIARCGFERAFIEGKTNWQKPLSCHLFPIRIRPHGRDYLRYEQIEECKAGRTRGSREEIRMFKFLKDPLVRKYGEDWYRQLEKYCGNENTRQESV